MRSPLASTFSGRTSAEELPASERTNDSSVAVGYWHCAEHGQRLREDRRQCGYPNGGNSSVGSDSAWPSFAAERSIASARQRAALRDSLHWKCLTRIWHDSGGGAVAFAANSATR